MKASDFIVEKILEAGTDKVFGYIGGMITHIADSLFQNKDIEMINSIHEQGAGFMAEGYARNTSKIGVAISTSGPGATNLLTPVASCYYDSTPALFITGQVNTDEYKFFPKIRQCGFQETNIVDMAKPVTKYAVMIKSVEDLRYELEKCLYLTQEGRKGPVLLDIPMNIQRADVDFSKMKSFFEEIENLPCQINIQELTDLINASKRPVVLVGGGVRLSKATNELKVFLTKTNLPVVHSLMGLDATSSDYKYNLGLIGAYGNRYGNFTLANSDLILTLGSRLDLRQIGANSTTFARSAKIIQVDIDENELNCDNLEKIIIKSDVKNFLNKLNNEKFDIKISEWQNKILEWKNEYPSIKTLEGSTLLPNEIISKIFYNLKNTDTISVDVGQHQMWAAQNLSLSEPRSWITSGGLGTMGFGLPAAIGAQIAQPGKRTICIVGDGGMKMTGCELFTVASENLPIITIIVDNSCLGMVRQLQQLFYEKRYSASLAPVKVDFVYFAKAFGIDGHLATTQQEFNQALAIALSSDKAQVIVVKIPVEDLVTPMLVPNASLNMPMDI